MKKNLLVLFSILLFLSCSKEDSPEEIKQKQYPVYCSINSLIKPTEFSLITSVDRMRLYYDQRINTKYGNKGVLIIRWESQIRAFDVACPYEWDNRINLLSGYKDIWSIGEEITCSSCKSGFSPFTGQALSGKAQEEGINMVQYKVEIRNVDGSKSEKELVVTN